MSLVTKARVFMNGRSQHVTIPAEYRFSSDEVYVSHDADSGTLTLSQTPPRRSMAEVFTLLDQAGAADFVLERDLTPPLDVTLLGPGRRVRTKPLYMLDTNMGSYVVSGRSHAARQTYLETEPYAVIVISAITEAEIGHGLEKKPEVARLHYAYNEFFATIGRLPWDSDAALSCGRLRAGLNAAGKSLLQMDLLVASHAIAVGAALVTHDGAFMHLGQFLRVVDWAPDVSA